MDNLLLKIICTAIILVLFAASCHDSVKDDNGNDVFPQPATDPPMADENLENQNYGMRDKVEERIDNPASSRSHNDSNPN